MKSNFIRTLFVSFGISLALLMLTSIASYVSIHNLLDSAGWVNHTNVVIQKLEEILTTIKDAETGQRGFLLTGQPEFLEPYNGAQAKALQVLKEVKTLVSDNPEQVKSCTQLEDIVVSRLTRLQWLIDAKNQNKTIDPAALKDGKRYMDEARDIIRMMIDRESTLLTRRTGTMNKFATYTPILITLAALLAILITIFSFRQIRREFTQRSLLQQSLEDKDAETTRRIDIIQSLANKIASGNFSIRLDEQEKDGLSSLSGSLNKMAESLDDSFKEILDKEWLQTGLADLNNLMVGDQDVQTLTNNVTGFVAEYIGCQAGALYILNETSQLSITGSYAVKSDSRNSTLDLGEGLAGQCAVSRKEIITKDIPENSIYISFASGEARPGNIIDIPVFNDGAVAAVIELASFKRFTSSHIAFLKTGAHNIGVAIASSQNRKKLQELLEETQTQAEELQAQHTEMENLNAELEAQTQKLQASEEELRVQQEELMQSNQELEERSRLLEEKNQVIVYRNLEIQKKAEELAMSTKYKSEFLANMSHELRTPLNSILLLSRLMAENKELRLNSEEVSYAKVIRSSGEGLLSLIDEILDLSKIEAGKMDLQFADVQIREIADDMNSLFAPIAKEKDLQLKIEIGPDTPAKIHTDKMRLEQILKNLLSNALKFTSKGSITLQITVHPTDNSLINFAVKDTGIGIARNKQQLVFEAFQQADGSTRRKYGGTGLGLSISRELTRLLGGQIHLNSEEGKGTEFIITIPVKETEGPVHEAVNDMQESTTAVIPQNERIISVEEPVRERYLNPVKPSSIEDDRNNIQKNDKTILVIEDDTHFAKALRNFSRENGYKTLVAVSGDEGIELAGHFKPVAILLDIVLPVKDGWEVMEALKSNPQTRHIPVHIMSSMEVKKEGIMKGAVDYINKPFAPEKMGDIFHKLESVLKKENKKVLIVEENPKHAKALSLYLESFHVSSEIKSNIAESVSALKKEDVDCIILDMGIPDQSAYETMEAIKKNEGLENLPIIIFTGKNLSKSEETRIKQYADSIVVKTAHSYQRILDEVSLFLHLIGEGKSNKKDPASMASLGALHEVLNNKTVLIADDDVRNIFSLTKTLEQYKMKVISATDGKDALKLLQETPGIDLVLMDMMMPEMDGYEATRKIREIPRFRRLPVLAVTAKAMMGDREKCMKAGASDYISKPVDMDQLISLLRVWLYDRES
ncbi:MAG: response regulator [Chitinophagaceae bacterium]|nr:response regulator [Chitinophagaceae bacterium]